MDHEPSSEASELVSDAHESSERDAKGEGLDQPNNQSNDSEEAVVGPEGVHKDATRPIEGDQSGAEAPSDAHGSHSCSTHVHSDVDEVADDDEDEGSRLVCVSIEGDGALGAKLRYHPESKTVTLHGWECEDGKLFTAIQSVQDKPFEPVLAHAFIAQCAY